MANARVPSAFEDFKRLSPTNYIYEPPSTISTRSTSNNDPSLIIFAAWMDANPKHIAKYLNHYKQTYPHARILLITTTSFLFIWRTSAADFEHINGAATVLETLPEDAKVLLHFFSNGGGTVACALALEYRKRRGAQLPVDAMVLDSAPGMPWYWQGHEAMTHGLPKGFLPQLVGGILMHIFLCSYWTFHKVFNIENIILAERRMLNDETLFTKDVPRLYLYGEADRVVYAADVEKHAEEAKKLGYPVESVHFEGSGHVAHMSKHGDQYWQAVASLWKGL